MRIVSLRRNRLPDARHRALHAQHRVRIEQLIELWMEKALGLSRIAHAARHQQLGNQQRQPGFARQRCQPRPDRSRKESSAGSGARAPPQTCSRLFVGVLVVQHDVAEILQRLQQLLIALIPRRGVLVQKHDALVRKAQLDIPHPAHMRGQRLRLVD